MVFRILFLRLLPWLTALSVTGLVVWQWNHERTYPWPIVLGLALYIGAVSLMAWRRLSVRDVCEKFGPSTLSLGVFGMSFLLVETPFERWVLSILLVGSLLLILELLFLLTHDAARYPVNGLSRVNLTLVPIGAFYLMFTLSGLLTFIRIPWWVAIGMCMTYASLVFFLTCHPMADVSHRRRWFLLGGCVGAHMGILAIVLPVGMAVQGAIGAFLLSFPLRVRRYAFEPVPSARLAWVESTSAIIGFSCLLLVSRWA